ncbi:hypothetical protein [Pseudomonas sp. AU8050]|uniref:hypothetical protein n=1 Tax=Pseudomonas sp. AU8050 TaxID=2681497 RepID=UPI0014075742|nr:hypothetical protein [Pseudomonas sp. AU8050]NHC53082.1 hypothetical protein [Pseudomonas sp. AU8050]
METKHTPGPWTLQGEPESIRIEGPRNRNSRSHLVLVERVGGRRYGADFSDLSELVANAKLIAAAPDLLEALIKLHESLESLNESGDAGQMVADDVETARAAIAKATA